MVLVWIFLRTGHHTGSSSSSSDSTGLMLLRLIHHLDRLPVCIRVLILQRLVRSMVHGKARPARTIAVHHASGAVVVWCP